MKKIAALAGLSLCFLFPAAHAADAAQSWQQNGGWSLHFGTNKGGKRLTINRETSPFWEHRFASSRIELVGEFGASYWWTNRTPAPGYSDHNLQLSAVPLFRYWATDRFYVEAGIGVAAFSERRFNQANLSSTFQFSDHIGAGYQLTPNTRIGVRASHFSNAGFKQPNDGVNSFQVTLGSSF